MKLACIARLHAPSKGHDVLFRVLEQLKWRRRVITISLYYDSAPNELSLKNLVRRLGLDGVVKFRGFSSVIETVWKQHHALILPSRNEGLPRSLIEAMLCGRMAIVTGNAGGNAEVMVDNHTGFIAEALTPKLLDEAMERAWERRDEWRMLGKNAAEHIRTLVPEDPVGEFVGMLFKTVNL